jgi:hypothetical protein
VPYQTSDNCSITSASQDKLWPCYTHNQYCVFNHWVRVKQLWAWLHPSLIMCSINWCQSDNMGPAGRCVQSRECQSDISKLFNHMGAVSTHSGMQHPTLKNVSITCMPVKRSVQLHSPSPLNNKGSITWVPVRTTPTLLLLTLNNVFESLGCQSEHMGLL